MHSTAAVAAAAVVACASLLGLAAVLSPRGAAAPSAALQGATTFVWATDDGPGGAGPPPAARSSVQRQGASATAARGRLAAVKRAARNAEPMGFDISRTLDSAFRRGEQGSTSLIHIDLPIQQYQIGKTVGGGKANMRAYNGDGTALPIYLRLNKVEAATLKEEKQDPGGVSRLKAMGTHFAKRVDKVLVSIGNKLKLADKWREEHHVPNALSELQAIQVSKNDQAKWAKSIQDLDDVIAAHGGDPPPENDSMRRARQAQTMQQQLIYERALKRAFGKQPTLPVP
eukprot:Tamp_16185.p1 GENE.Tamp_16185~~Tamp_16185.p1  ORF type:complete len:309 (+),score=67.75 Tamp_16185:73-927(+)